MADFVKRNGIRDRALDWRNADKLEFVHCPAATGAAAPLDLDFLLAADVEDVLLEFRTQHGVSPPCGWRCREGISSTD
jgi:hypothetical protein